jgi:hypothetical protein
MPQRELLVSVNEGVVALGVDKIERIGVGDILVMVGRVLLV